MPLQGGHTNSQYCLFSTFVTNGNAASPWVVTGSEDSSLCVYDLGSKQVRAATFITFLLCCVVLCMVILIR